MANPSKSAEQVVAERLVAQSVSVGGATAARGTNLFEGPVLPADKDGLIPSACLFAQPYGGSVPEPYLGIGTDYREFSVQLLIRDKDYDRGIATARACFVALHRYNPGDTGYVTMTVRNEIVPLGKDGQDQYRWVLNIRADYCG